MPDPSFYRDQAERCLQLARVATDRKMAQDLRDLGQEFLAKAAESEASPEASDTSAAR